MKNEAEVLDLLQRVYACNGRDPADIVRVKPHYGGWLNALQYDVIRTDGAIATVRRKHVYDSNYDALADELREFAVPGSKTRLCRQCGKWMPDSARYCQACGDRLEHASGPLPPRTSTKLASSRLARRATAVVSALICVVGVAAYLMGIKAPSSEAARAEPSPPRENAFEPTVAKPGAQAPAEPSNIPAQIKSATAESVPPPNDNPISTARVTPDPPTQNSASPPEAAPLKSGSKRPRAPLSAEAAKERAAVRNHTARTARHSIDRAYEHLTGARCSAGLGGFLCREKVRFKLCKDHWTEHDVPGESVCRVVKFAHRTP